MTVQTLDPVDALVVGGGVAGLSAASWLGRHRRRTLVADAGRARNLPTEQIHGLLGHEGISPQELLERGREDLARYPHVDVVAGEVTAAHAHPSGFTMTIDGDRSVTATRLVLSTGVRDEMPDIEGITDHYGRDVFHCPTCDGYEARDRAVAVMGWGQHVPAFAVELLDWAEKVHIVTDSTQSDITTDQRERLLTRGVTMVEGTVDKLCGSPGALEGVRLSDGRQVEANLAFFSVAHHPVVDLAVQLGCQRTEDGRLQVDEHGLTTVEGVYAAGDVTPGMQLLAVAAAEGTVAGVACAASLHGRVSAPGAPTPAPDPGPLAPEHVPDTRQHATCQER